MKPWLFWTIPIFLFIAQLLFILNSQTQIRYEDLAESVRNVFWLENGLIYDGVSSNVGWYGTLLIIYKLFGFHLHAAQFFRLALYLVSMICLGLLLRKYVENFWLPWLMVGLSPTILYFNTIQTGIGIDLLYFPIVLLLITHAGSHLVKLMGWALSMWAWMSYPTFIFYLPALVILNLIQDPLNRFRVKHGMTVWKWFVNLLAFLIPLALVFIYVQNRLTLLYDPKINSGIFRGGGNFEASLDNIAHNLGGLFTDLFVRGNSYHFEVFMGEFSLIFPILTVVLVFISLKMRNKWVNLALVSILIVLILSSLTLDPSGAPGIRRYTPVLAAFYALFVIVWQSGTFKKWGMMILGLLLIHHLIVYPINLIHLKDPSPEAYPIWFNTAETPAKSLQTLVDTVQKEDLKLVCDGYCRLSEVYAAVAGSCKWNHLDCHQILGWDPKTGNFIPLTVDLWNSYYFEH